MLCYYHDDLDGRCAAAIVRRAMGGGRFIAADYRRSIPLPPLATGETVVVVDYFPDPHAMQSLRQRAQRLIWIDHHASSMACRAYAGLEGRREEGRAACELVWEYFYPQQPLPRSVSLAADRDVWTWHYGEETASFCEGIRLIPHGPEDTVWQELLAGDRPTLETILREGAVCRRYQLALAVAFVERYGFETEFEGYRCFAANLNLFGSDVFGERFDRYEICISFTYDGFRYHITLYSQQTDVLPLAVRHGGGGHHGAAGFSRDRLPFAAASANMA